MNMINENLGNITPWGLSLPKLKIHENKPNNLTTTTTTTIIYLEFTREQGYLWLPLDFSFFLSLTVASLSLLSWFVLATYGIHEDIEVRESLAQARR